jgi:hypothetical protein
MHPVAGKSCVFGKKVLHCAPNLEINKKKNIKNTAMTERLTNRKRRNVVDTFCFSVCEYTLTSGGGGNYLYDSYLVACIICGGFVRTTMPPKVTVCFRISAKAGLFFFLSVFLHAGYGIFRSPFSALHSHVKFIFLTGGQ